MRRDLPDLTRWFLATGVRIGEAIAVDRENIDLDDQLVQIDTRSSESRARAFGVFPGSSPRPGTARSRCLCSPFRCWNGATRLVGRRPTLSRLRRRLARPFEHVSRPSGSPWERGVRVGHEPRLPQDVCDDPGRERAVSPRDRRPTRAREGVHDAGQLPRPAADQPPDGGSAPGCSRRRGQP